MTGILAGTTGGFVLSSEQRAAFRKNLQAQHFGGFHELARPVRILGRR
jgi:hypothetical protein